MAPPVRQPPQGAGSVPAGPMALADTAGLHVKIDAFQKSLDDHMVLDRQEMQVMHTRMSGSKKFQYITTGATVAVVALLGWIALTFGTVVQGNVNKALKASNLVGIPVRVEMLQKQLDDRAAQTQKDLDKKASKEGAAHRDVEIHDLKARSHTHRRR